MSDERHVALINDLLSLPAETSWVEFKVSNTDPEMIGKTISAISNAARLLDKAVGYVLWGIDNSTHQIVGTDFVPSKKKKGNQILEMWLGQMLDPCPNIRFYQIEIGMQSIVLLEVPTATHAPVTYNRQAYIRVGSGTPLLSEHRNKERSLWAKLQTFAWERGIAQSFLTGEKVLELLNYTSYFDLTNQKVPASRSNILTKMAADHLVEVDVGGRWNILNLGAILFAKDLTAFPMSVARKALRIVEYNGTDKTKSKDRKDQKKGYAAGFEE